MLRGGADGSQRVDRFVVVVGDSETVRLVATATDETTRISRRETVPDRLADEPIDGLVVDAACDWRALVADGEPPVPTILLADETTPLGEAVAAGITDCVRRDDEAAGTLVARRLSTALTAANERADQVRRDEWLATLVRHSTDSMSVVAEDGTALYNSPSVEEQLGYSPTELRGQNLLDQIHPDDREAVEATFSDLLAEPDGSYATATYRRRHADGSWRWIEAVGNVQTDNPQVGGVIVNRRDVTEREQHREQLRDQEAYVQSLLDAQPDIFYVLDADGYFTRWNARLSAVLGYDDEELAEMHGTEVVVPDDRERIMDALATVYHEQEPQQQESALLTADGEAIPYQVNGAPLTNADGEVTGLVGTGRDISQRVRREERLTVLNRVLRHNLRNRTNIVIGNAERLAEELAGDGVERAESSERAQLIERAEAIRSAGADLDRLGLLARKVDTALEDPEPVAIPSAPVVERATGVVPEAATLSVGQIPDVELSALPAFEDALGELLDNAVRHNPNEEPSVRVEVTADTEQVVVRVADDGDGIPDHEVAALEDGESRLQHGAGLGLWFVNWVVDASGGTLTFEDSEYGGTLVTVRLPRAE